MNNEFIYLPYQLENGQTICPKQIDMDRYKNSYGVALLKDFTETIKICNIDL